MAHPSKKMARGCGVVTMGLVFTNSYCQLIFNSTSIKENGPWMWSGDGLVFTTPITN
jgi:hypothetical protein